MTTSNLVETPELKGDLASFQLQDKVVLLLLTLNAPGNERTVRDKTILKTDADHGQLHVGKRLLDCKEQRDIAVFDGQMRDYVKRVALPTPFKAGTHVIALDLLTVVDARLSDFAEKRRALVERFAAVYSEAKNTAKTQLGELYSEGEYLTPEELDGAYRMSWQYVTLVAPDRMKGMSSEIFEREKTRLQEQWDSAIGDMREALRVGLAELVNDMVARLAGDEKKFKPTKLLERFDEFLSTFDARNVTNDEELKALADQCRTLLAGVDTDSLKKTKEVRESVREGLAVAQATLVQLETVGRQQRRITFDDE